MKRLFIAVPLNEATKEKLAGILHELKYVGFGAKIELIDNIHITLKFLGSTEIKKLEILNTVLNEIAHSFTSFIIQPKGFGFFPNAKYARICWMGIEEPTKTLFSIQNEIEQRLSKEGFVKENREFKAHLTLVRIKNPGTTSKLVEKIEQCTEIHFDPMKVKYFSLHESILKPQGAHYSCLNKYYLKE